MWRQAFLRALEVDPYFPEALANAGLAAAGAGDYAATRGFLERLRAISPLGVTPEERALHGALVGRPDG